MTVETVLAIAGCISLFVGIFGGGIEIKEIKIPPIPTWARIVFSFIGFFFVFVAIFLIKPDIIQDLPSTQKASQNTETSVSFTSTAAPSDVAEITSAYTTDAIAVFTSPSNFSFVEAEQDISGTLTKIKSNESAFLCLQNRSENPITNCYGELETNMVDAWTVTIKFRAENQPFDLYVVVTADEATADILRQSKNGGIFINQMANVKTISDTLSVTSR